MADQEIEIQSPSATSIKILKWKVKKGSMISKGSVLALYTESGEGDNSISKKLKAVNTGLVSSIRVEENALIKPGEVLLSIQQQSNSTCSHPTIMKDMCAECGADLRIELGNSGDRTKAVSASVAMVHSIPELIVSKEQALELGREDENRLLQQKKLVLLVDLDQTLIHTTNDNIPPNLKDVKHFQLKHGPSFMWYHTRFRPYTLQFLKTISSLYELHICTFGVRMYAHIIARLMDPKEKYFSHRILSRDECFDALSKTANLKALFPCGDKMVGIIDDREDVWNFAPNLIHVKPYRFFQGTADINAPPGLTKSEHDSEPLSHKIVDHACDKENKPEESAASEKPEEKSESSSNDKESAGSEKEPSVTEDGATPQAESVETTGRNEEEKSDQTDSARTVVKDSSGIPDSEQNVSHSNTCDKQGSRSEEKVEIMDTQDNTHLNNKQSTKTDKENSEEKTEDSQSQTKSQTEKELNVGKEGEEIEWDDEDDYLLHLTEILTRVHTAYYSMYEQYQKNGSSELPDLKSILPYVRKKVLKGANLVFSGMFPLNVPLEKSRAHQVAVALGANVQTDFIPRKVKSVGASPDATTHLVAAKPGTGKHKSAMKLKGVKIVSGDWLWACNERWEWVDERLFPLVSKEANSGDQNEEGKERVKKRKSDNDGEDDGEDGDEEMEGNEKPKSRSPSKKQKKNTRAESSRTDGSKSSKSEKPDESSEAFAESYNPLYSFSDEDLEFMDKEVEEMMDNDDDEEEEDVKNENDSEEEWEASLRKKVLGTPEESDSDSDSLTGDFPRGLKLRRKSMSPEHKNTMAANDNSSAEEGDEETENELERYQKNMDAFAPVDSESSEMDEDSIGSADDEIAEALEKEFLGSL